MRSGCVSLVSRDMKQSRGNVSRELCTVHNRRLATSEGQSVLLSQQLGDAAIQSAAEKRTTGFMLRTLRVSPCNATCARKFDPVTQSVFKLYYKRAVSSTYVGTHYTKRNISMKMVRLMMQCLASQSLAPSDRFRMKLCRCCSQLLYSEYLLRE